MRSQAFKYHQAIGDPIPTIKRLSDWLSDEIIILNISSTLTMDSRRSDKWHNLGKGTFSELIRQASKYCFCPLSVGGGIKSLDDFGKFFESGADKCVINTLLFDSPEIVSNAVKKYGSQSIVGSIDIKYDKKKNKILAYKKKELLIQN